MAHRKVGALSAGCGAIMLVTAVLVASPGPALAQRVEGREFAAAVNLTGRDVKADGLMFVPDGVRRIAGVVLVVDYGAASNQLYYSEDLRRVLRDIRCAAALVRITSVSSGPPDRPVASQVLRNAAVGGGDALQALLRELASVTGYKELRSAPLLLWGFSAAASFGATYADAHPERVLGVVRYHTHRRGLTADVQGLTGIPLLIIAGAKDETAGVDDAEELWRQGRALGAPWTLAVEPDADHASLDVHERTARDLTVPWISGVVRRRLEGGIPLRPLSIEQSWLGDRGTLELAPSGRFTQDTRTANWFPDEASARGWYAVVRPSVRPERSESIAGEWTGQAILGTNRAPLSMQVKLDGTMVSVAINMGGVVGDTTGATFDPQEGRLTFEVRARPSNNPRGVETVITVEAFAIDNAATGHFKARNATGDFAGRFFMSRR